MQVPTPTVTPERLFSSPSESLASERQMDQFRIATATAPLKIRAISAADALGLSSKEIHAIVKLLPKPLLNAPCFLDALTDLWRYEFGMPIDRLASGMVMYGTHMYHQVDHLVQALACAKSRLTPVPLHHFITRLADPAKHKDVLIEMLPVLRLHPDIPADYEVLGHGRGNHTIDWLISPSEGTPILVEVKHRKRDMIEYVDRIPTQQKSGITIAPEHNTDLLFQSLETKFLPRHLTHTLQGAWIHVAVQQEQSELQKSFDKLDPDRIHFAILGSWQEDVFLLARAGFDHNRLLTVLGRKNSDRFIFQRGV